MRVIDPIYMVIVDSANVGIDDDLSEDQIKQGQINQAEFDEEYKDNIATRYTVTQLDDLLKKMNYKGRSKLKTQSDKIDVLIKLGVNL